MPQGSVLSTILLNIYSNVLFFLPKHTEVCNFPDDKPFHVRDQKGFNMIYYLLQNGLIAIVLNYIRINDIQLFCNIDCKRKCQKLLRFEIDRKLNFQKYLISLSKKAGKKHPFPLTFGCTDKIYHIQETPLCLVNKDCKSSFSQSLGSDKSLTIRTIFSNSIKEQHHLNQIFRNLVYIINLHS